jgi:hypothetical protein
MGAFQTATGGDFDALIAKFQLPAPDLTVAKTHTGSFTQGQTGATYTITAMNSGTFATSGTVTIVGTLHTGLTATAISSTVRRQLLATDLTIYSAGAALSSKSDLQLGKTTINWKQRQ